MTGVRGRTGPSKNSPDRVEMAMREDLANRLEFDVEQKDIPGPSHGRVHKRRRRRAPRKAHRDHTTDRLTTLKLSQTKTRLMIVGHSWVERLKRLKINSFKQDGREVEVRYKFRRGLTYDEVLGDETILYEAGKWVPHYVLVIMGGNDIGSPKPIEEVETECSIFHSILREHCPQAIIIAAQMENRFYEEGNIWGAPTGTDFAKKRKRFNSFMHIKLRDKDHLLRMGAPAQQENKNCFEDSAHLKPKEYAIYFERIKAVLRKVHGEMDKKIQEEALGDKADELSKKIKERMEKTANGRVSQLSDKLAQRLAEEE